MDFFSAKAAKRKPNKDRLPNLQQALVTSTKPKSLRALALKQSSSVEELLSEAENCFPDWRDYLRSAISKSSDGKARHALCLSADL